MNALSAVLAISVLLAGCGSDSSEDSYLSSFTWLLNGYRYQQDKIQTPLADTRYELLFTQTEVSGTLDCNSFSSTYLESDGQISIDDVAPTEMACQYQGDAQQYQTQNSFIVYALSTASSFTVSGNTLVITALGGEQLYYQATAE